MTKNASHSIAAVNEIHRYLVGQGGQDVHPEFSIAQRGQYDVVFDDHRYLLTPNDDSLSRYRKTVEIAGQEALAADEHLSALNPHVTALELPRDARTLEQVITSTNTEEATSENVFGLFGRAIGAVALSTHLLPEAESIPLDKVLYSRIKNAVILPPAIKLHEYSPDSSYKLDNAIRNQLLPRYKKFGASAMYNAYLVGKRQ